MDSARFNGKLAVVIELQTTLNATQREECNLQESALCVTGSEFICFSVPVKQLKASPMRRVRASGYVTGRKMKNNDDNPDNFDFSRRRFPFNL